jgi:dTDP-4-dehydrorhamnose reductase
LDIRTQALFSTQTKAKNIDLGIMRILITGSNGLLGQRLVVDCLDKGIDFLGVSSGPNRNPACPETSYFSLDVTNLEEVSRLMEKESFGHIIHTAAMTNVDACEKDPEQCYRINHKASAHLFSVAKNKNIHFTLLSTDFVFDGNTGNYKETDTPHPLSVYGRSKWLAEQELLNSTSTNWSIARTIIVYGKGYALNKSNIFSWLIQELSAGKEVSLITDHYRAPTWVNDLSEGCLAIIMGKKQGVFHLCGPETLSIYEIGIRVAHYLGVSSDLIKPIDSKTLNQPAPRPPKTGFDLTKSEVTLGYQPHLIEATLPHLS